MMNPFNVRVGPPEGIPDPSERLYQPGLFPPGFIKDPPAKPDPQEEANFWEKFLWASVPAPHRNLDSVPSHLVPERCPCGAAWAELHAVGLVKFAPATGTFRESLGLFLVQLVVLPRLAIASRLECCSGDLVNYDSVSKRLDVLPPASPVPNWLVPAGLMVSLGALMYASLRARQP